MSESERVRGREEGREEGWRAEPTPPKRRANAERRRVARARTARGEKATEGCVGWGWGRGGGRAGREGEEDTERLPSPDLDLLGELEREGEGETVVVGRGVREVEALGVPLPTLTVPPS